jgi:hypothetical protein
MNSAFTQQLREQTFQCVAQIGLIADGPFDIFIEWAHSVGECVAQTP